MLKLSREAVARLTHETRRGFAADLLRWWALRLPWFVELLEDDAEATGLHVIAESEAHGYVQQSEIMRYSLGYIFFGSRFADSPLHENLMARCYWREAVAPILKLLRILDHVDMLLWNGTFTAPRGNLTSIPDVTGLPAQPLTPVSLEFALRSTPARRLVHLDLDALDPYVQQVLPGLSASGVPESWLLRAATLGVFLGWNYPQSPAFGWLIAAMRRDDPAEITRRLHGTDRP